MYYLPALILSRPWGDKSHNNPETNSSFFMRLLPQGLRRIYQLQNHVHIAFTAERDKKNRRQQEGMEGLEGIRKVPLFKVKLETVLIHFS